MTGSFISHQLLAFDDTAADIEGFRTAHHLLPVQLLFTIYQWRHG
jgi:hypothetical protein